MPAIASSGAKQQQQEGEEIAAAAKQQQQPPRKSRSSSRSSISSTAASKTAAAAAARKSRSERSEESAGSKYNDDETSGGITEPQQHALSYSEDALSHSSAPISASSSNFTFRSQHSKSDMSPNRSTNRSRDRNSTKSTQMKDSKSSECSKIYVNGMRNYMSHFHVASYKLLFTQVPSRLSIISTLALILISLHMMSSFAIRPLKGTNSLTNIWQNEINFKNFITHSKLLLSVTYSCREFTIYLLFTAILNFSQNFLNLSDSRIFVAVTFFILSFMTAINATSGKYFAELFQNPASIASLAIHHYVIDIILRINLSYFDASKKLQVTGKQNRIPSTRNSRSSKSLRKVQELHSLYSNLYPSNVVYNFMRTIAKIYYSFFSIESFHNFETRSALWNILIGVSLFLNYLFKLSPTISPTFSAINHQALHTLITYILMHFIRGYKACDDSDLESATDALFDLKFWKYSVKIMNYFILLPVFSSFPLRYSLLDLNDVSNNNNNNSFMAANHFYHLILSTFGLILLTISRLDDIEDLIGSSKSSRKANRKNSLWHIISSHLFSPTMIAEQIILISMIISHKNTNILEGLAMDALFIRNIFDIFIAAL